MSRAQSPSLEITVVSAEGLRIGNRFVTKNVFVTVRTDPINQQSTKLEGDGGGNPSWNEKLHLPLPAAAASPATKWVVGVEVQRKASSGSPQMIGTANIPMSDVVGGYIPPNHLHFLSYRLRGSDGRRNGIINLSIKVVGLEPGKNVSSHTRIAVGIPVAASNHIPPPNMHAGAQGIPIGIRAGMVVSPRFEYVKS